MSGLLPLPYSSGCWIWVGSTLEQIFLEALNTPPAVSVWLGFTLRNAEKGQSVLLSKAFDLFQYLFSVTFALNILCTGMSPWTYVNKFD
jgi:hypothetical protein